MSLGANQLTHGQVASFTKEVNSSLAKRPLVFNGHLANLKLTSLGKEATGYISELVCDLFSCQVIGLLPSQHQAISPLAEQLLTHCELNS